MDAERVERRRERRVELEAALQHRSATAKASQAFAEAMTKDLSLGGLYFEAEGRVPYAPNDLVNISVTVPASSGETFPFRRLVGRSRVVRVAPLGSKTQAGGQRVGVALEFGDDVLALTGLPSRA